MTTVCLVLVAGLLVACTAQPGVATESPSPSPTDTATPTTTATPSPTPSPTEEETPSPTPSPTEGPLGDAQACENEELGYAVDYPEDWWANERIEPEDENLTPIPACQFFAPSEVELQPNAGLPNGIAIRFELVEEEIDPPDEEIIDTEETMVDGHQATIIETEPAPQPGFVPEGSRIYRYVIELDGGDHLVATTDDILQDDSAYEESKEILDAMMETLDIQE